MIGTTLHYRDADALVTELIHLERVVEPRYGWAHGDGSCFALRTDNPARTALNLGRVLASENIDIEVAAAFVDAEVSMERLDDGWVLMFPGVVIVWEPLQ